MVQTLTILLRVVAWSAVAGLSLYTMNFLFDCEDLSGTEDVGKDPKELQEDGQA